MTESTQVVAAGIAIVAIFVAVQLGALALVEPFDASDRQVVEDPDDPGSGLLFFGAILLATVFMLAGFRYNADLMIRAVIIGVSGMLAWIVFSDIVPPVATIASVNILALAGSLTIVAGLVLHPEWYVIDLAGIVMGAGAAGLFGISLGILPVILFLLVLALYDAISVYRTEHMLSLAEGVMDLHIPVVLVVPLSLSYSFLEDTPADESAEEDSAAEDEGERDAFFIGLGDAVIPTILVVSVAVFGGGESLPVPGLTITLPTLGAMVGTILGLAALLFLVHRGRPHAGLPLLNGGAILGYLAVALALGASLPAAIGL